MWLDFTTVYVYNLWYSLRTRIFSEVYAWLLYIICNNHNYNSNVIILYF